MQSKPGISLSDSEILFGRKKKERKLREEGGGGEEEEREEEEGKRKRKRKRKRRRGQTGAQPLVQEQLGPPNRLNR